MSPLFHLYIKDMKLFFADRGAVIMAFVVPVLMALIFGYTFGGAGDSVIEDLEINFDVVDKDKSEISAMIVNAIDEDEILILKEVSEEDAYTHVKGGKRSAALIIPDGFGDLVKASENVDLKIIYDPSNQLENGLIKGKMQQILFSSDLGKIVMPNMMEDLLRANGEDETSIKIAKFYMEKYIFPEEDSAEKIENENSDEPSTSSMDAMFDDFPINIINEQIVGQDVNSSAGYVQSVVSAMVMFLLFGISFGAGSLLREKNSGTLKRLLTAPISVEGILTAKLLGLLTTGMMQIYFMLIFGWLVFHLEIWAYPFQLFLMAFGTSLMASGLGVLLTGIAKTEEQIGNLAPLVILSLSAVGGAMVPRFIMPKFLLKLGVISPVSWAVDGFHNVFWQHQGLTGMLPQFGMLLAFATIFLTVGIILVKAQIKKM